MSDENLAIEPAIADTNAIASEVVAESAPASPEPAAPERDKVQERFDKITREKYEALRAADTERYQRERLEERIRQLETKPDPVVPDELPTLEAYEFDEAKYRTALAAYYKADAEKTVEQALTRREQQAKQQERESAFQTRQAAFIASKPDYADKVLNNRALPITNDMAQVIRDSEIGPQVAYYLAENVDKAIAIAALSPLAQAREIGRIEARLEAIKAAPPPAVSKAPPPPPRIEATEPAVDLDPATMTDKQYAQWRKRQIAQRR